LVSFKLTEEQEAIRKMARSFAEKEIIPIAAEYDEKEEIPWQVVEKAFEVGLMNLEVPEEYDGQGQDAVTVAIVNEEGAYGCLGINGGYGANGLALMPILIAATDEQKKKFLAPFCAKPQLAAFCLTEPGAGSDAGAVSTVARLKGDEYVIDGAKHFITNGTYASLLTVFAKTDTTKGVKGISAFIVPGDLPGVKRGEKEKKTGVRAMDCAEVTFEEVRVPKGNLLGNEGDGFKIAMMTLDRTRPMVAACATGVARRALEEAIKYSKERVQFGKPICANQAIQFMLADMAIKIEAARALTWQASWMIDEGLPVSKVGAMAKCFAADTAMSVTVDAVQIFGGYGYMREYPVEKLVRDAKILQIYEGTNQVQRMVIAGALLGK
jgi:acyl-CoA dehydrogenase